MGIVNRTMDSSEQQYVAQDHINATTTGKSDSVFHFPNPALLSSAKLSGVGLSGSPTAQLQIRRFVTGAGQTLIPLGAALAIQAVSTSGPQSYTFSNGASTQVMAGDIVCVTHAGTNAGLEQLHVAIVCQATQDIRSWGL